jgi:hypothetical protein
MSNRAFISNQNEAPYREASETDREEPEPTKPIPGSNEAPYRSRREESRPPQILRDLQPAT